MKTKIIIAFLTVFTIIINANSQNSYPTTGDAEINSGKLIVQTNTVKDVITLRDVHYTPFQVYNFQIQSDGLYVKQDDNYNYQFKSGGDFIVRNGKLGIGTFAPSGKLHISTDVWSESLLTFTDSHYTPNQVYKFQIESDGLKIRQDNVINYQFKSGGDFIVNNGSVGIGTGTDVLDAKLAVRGDIHTKEVRVDVIGSMVGDYVFEKDYNLIPLPELETYLKQNKHLPEVPSAKEFEAEGMKLKEMNLMLLKKVEELTLYLIEQQKIIKKQNERITKLEN